MSAWVLLRGWGREAAHWESFPAQLQEAVGGEVFAQDLPGNGALHRETSPASIPALLARVRAILGERGVRPPYRLLGLSLGAMVALDWAWRHPREVERAVLVNTSARPFGTPYQRLRPAAYATVSRLFATSDPVAREAGALRLTSAAHASDAALAARWARLARERPVSRWNALRQLVAAARFRAPATPPAVPLLALASEADRLVDPACSRSLARAWGLPIAVHPHAGHDLPLDDGPWVAARVREWIGQAERSAASGWPRGTRR